MDDEGVVGRDPPMIPPKFEVGKAASGYFLMYLPNLPPP
jgi:hypothetical protein